MSHIPSHAMPHAKPHDDEAEQSGTAPSAQVSVEPAESGSAELQAPAEEHLSEPQAAQHVDLPEPIPVPAHRPTSPPWAALAIGGALVAGGALIAVLAGRRSADGKPGPKQGRRRKNGKRSAEKD